MSKRRLQRFHILLGQLRHPHQISRDPFTKILHSHGTAHRILIRLYRHLVCQAEGSSQRRLDPQIIAIQTANFTPGFFDSFTIRFQ